MTEESTEGRPTTLAHDSSEYRALGHNWPDNTITWSFADWIINSDPRQVEIGSTFRPDGSDGMRGLIRDAFDAWEAVCGVDFVEVGDSADSDIRIGWTAPAYSDGPGGTVAYYRPWTLMGTSTTSIGLIAVDHDDSGVTLADIYDRVLHEVGHALGLAHSDVANVVMSGGLGTEPEGLTPYWGGVPGRDPLQPDDIAGAVALWGSADGGSSPPPTSGNDTLFGTQGADSIDGGAGNDTLFGRAGDDVLVGGGGSDYLNGGAGNDTVRGGDGNDTLLGGLPEGAGVEDSNVLEGGGGNDAMLGGPGNDRLVGGPGYDRMWGEGGNDTLEGGVGDDLIFGMEGDDVADGGEQNDIILGGLGNDSLLGSEGNDGLWGESGRDTIEGGSGHDFVAGGTGDDSLQGGGGEDYLLGGSGDDVLDSEDSGSNSSYDILVGGPGDDTLHGGRVGDTFWGEEGEDRFVLVAATTEVPQAGEPVPPDEGPNVSWIMDFQPGVDEIVAPGFTNMASAHLTQLGDHVRLDYDGGAVFLAWTTIAELRLAGGEGDDTIHGTVGHDSLQGFEGDDSLRGNSGADTIDGGSGNDTLEGGPGDDNLEGGAGSDLLMGGDDADTLEGGTSPDRLVGGPGDDSLSGGDGRDVLTGEHGDDTLEGGSGADTLEGGPGEDSLSGGDGRDQLAGGHGDDTLEGGAGSNIFVGGPGDDRFVLEAGTHLIRDYEPGYDEIVAPGLSDLAGHGRIAQVGDDVLVGFEGGTVVLVDTTLEELGVAPPPIEPITWF